jgi:hypothetical protein
METRSPLAVGVYVSFFRSELIPAVQIEPRTDTFGPNANPFCAQPSHAGELRLGRKPLSEHRLSRDSPQLNRASRDSMARPFLRQTKSSSERHTSDRRKGWTEGRPFTTDKSEKSKGRRQESYILGILVTSSANRLPKDRRINCCRTPHAPREGGRHTECARYFSCDTY